MHNIKIAQVVNAGLLIEGTHKKILIDGIHNVKTHEWSTVDNGLMDYIIYGKDKFQDINYLLFTHQHSDHFNLEKTCEYIRNNKTEHLITTRLNDAQLIMTDLLMELDKDFYEPGDIDFNNVKIKYIRTKHLAHEKVGIDHYVYIVEIDNKKILYLGDADFCKTELTQILKDIHVDVMIAPFIIVNSTIGRRFVTNVSPELLIINHLPNSEDDKDNYRSIIEMNVTKYKDEMPKTVIFQNLYDEATIINC
ncbi:Beta-lactamase superfamily domain protein [anaerobic digester metagenome]